MKIGHLIEEIEQRRRSRLLVFAASNLEIELLPALYDSLREIGSAERLDVLFYCRGGAVTAARRVALLLHQFTGHLSFLIPDRCESSGTIATLAAHEIVAGPAAIFSPVDPRLQAPLGADGDHPLAISAQDVRLFGRMSRDWFGVADEAAGAKAMALLCESIFPTTLTAFYRATLEVEAVCLELLSLPAPQGADEAKRGIVDRLLFGHHSHGFALSREDLRDLGLPVRDDGETEDLAWEIARHLRAGVGGGARASVDDEWIDGLLATRDGARRRRCSPDGLAPVWEAGEIE